MPANDKRLAVGLDLIRATAALLVFAAHLRGGSFVEFGALDPDQRTFITSVIFAITRLGREAVLTFFVLSGYLVGGQLLRTIADDTFRLGDYAIDRITRIFTPLIPACLLTAAVGVIIYRENTDWLQVFGNMVGLNGLLVETLPLNSPLWSLSCEIWFYITGGAIGVLMCRPNKLGAALMLIMALVAAWFYGPSLLLFWSMGAAMALLPKVLYPGRMAIFGCLILCAGSICIQISGASRSFATIPTIPPVLAEFLVCAGVAMIIPLATSNRTSEYLHRFRSVASFLSARSYTLYLIHHPVIWSFKEFQPPLKRLDSAALQEISIRVIAVLAACEIMFFLFEKRTPALRRLLRRRANVAAA